MGHSWPGKSEELGSAFLPTSPLLPSLHIPLPSSLTTIPHSLLHTINLPSLSPLYTQTYVMYIHAHMCTHTNTHHTHITHAHNTHIYTHKYTTHTYDTYTQYTHI